MFDKFFKGVPERCLREKFKSKGALSEIGLTVQALFENDRRFGNAFKGTDKAGDVCQSRRNLLPL